MQRMGTVSGKTVDSLGNVWSCVDCQVVEGPHNLSKGEASFWGAFLMVGEQGIRLERNGESGAARFRHHVVGLEEFLCEAGLADVLCTS